MKNIFSDEPSINSQVLKHTGKNLKIFYGAHAWGPAEWIGEIYPAGTKERDFLKNYVQHFNAIELNATHFRHYFREEIKKWADIADGKDFLFCPKVPQKISHYSFFQNAEDQTKAFIDSISAFEKHLGPVFLQVSDKFSPKRKEGLYNYLGSLPAKIQFFLEVRNPQWYEQGVYEEHLTILKAKNIGSVINDSPERILHPGLTLPKCFIRYTPTGDLSRVQQWFDKIKEWGNKGLTEAYFFVQPAMPGTAVQREGHTPEHFRPLIVEKPNLQLEALQSFKQLCAQD